MSVTIKLRLPVPEGRPGDVVQVSNQRAEVLVDRKYAIYVSGGKPPAATVAAEPADTQAATVDTGATPITDLPAVGDLKAEWVKAAEALGIDTQREDGSDKSKDELIEAVTEATG